MKRKVIQVADSTMLVSLPIKWARKYNIKKGDELDLETRGKDLLIKNKGAVDIKERKLEFKKYSIMINRTLHAMYKKGIDKIKVSTESPEQINIIQSAIGKETVGFEITNIEKNSCTIRCVAETTGEFDNLLRRIFLLQLTMSKESLDVLEKGEYERLKQIVISEETNNRLTTMCRRLINKSGQDNNYTGPLYYIIEDFENLADQYKYLFSYILECKDKISINKKIFEIYAKVNGLMEDFYKLYYKFDEDLVVNIGKDRKSIISEISSMMDNNPNKVELRVLHHLSIISQKIFCMVGPYLVLKL